MKAASSFLPGKDSSPYKSLLALGAILFKRGDFKLKAGALDDRGRLLGPAADAEFAALDIEKTRLPLRRAFPEGGYFVLGCEFDTPTRSASSPTPDRLATARSPHTATPTRSRSPCRWGRGIFIDPGTYAYHTQERAPVFPRHGGAQHAAHRRARPVGAGRQLHVAQAPIGVQPVAVFGRPGQLRGLARRLHAPGGPGKAPPPHPGAHRARQVL